MNRCPKCVMVGFALLLLGVGHTLQARSVPLLAPPATQPSTPAVKETLQSRARQIISDCLSDPNPQIRANAAEVVATTRDLLLAPKVQKLLADEVIPVRFAAALAIGDLAYTPARNEIVKLLSDPNPNIKIAASYAIAHLGHPEYYKVLCRSVGSDDQTVRANAALLLGKAGKQEGLQYLYWTIRRGDSTDKVILQAVESVATLKDRRIYPKLWTRLISAYADDRVIGIRAMGALGTREARDALLTMLDDTIPEVRLAAAEQLGKLGDPSGQPEVLAIVDEKPDTDSTPQDRERIKVLTALAIGEIGTPAVVKHLPDMLQDASKAVRLAAAKAILRVAARRARP